MRLYHFNILFVLLIFSLSGFSQEKEIVLKTSTGNISGSLLRPEGAKTVVIIIAGSGSTDRNGNTNNGVQTNNYQQLAQELSKENIASLRYDKRGIGRSSLAMIKEEDLTLDTYIKDVSDWIGFLRKDHLFKKVVLAGHSEGALIASIVAQNNPVDAAVLVAGPGRGLDVIVEEQFKRNPNNPPFILDQSKSIMDSIKAGHAVKSIPPYFTALYRPSVQPFLRSLLKYSPVEEVKKVVVPVLIIQGDSDLQVTIEDADLLAGANPKAKKVIIKGMSHTLKSVTDLTDNQKSYADPDKPLSSQLVPLIADFIRKL